MADIILENSATGFTAPSNGNRYILPQGRTVSTPDNIAFDFGNFTGTLDVHGSLIADGTIGGRKYAIQAISRDDPEPVNVNVSSTGIVSSDQSGMRLYATTATVVNDGRIRGYDSYGIQFYTSQLAEVRNTGTIVGRREAVDFFSQGTSRLVNEGMMTGANGIGSLGGISVENAGEIIGDSDATIPNTGFGIDAFSYRGSPVDVVNSGLIEGDVGSFQSRADNVDTIQNSGAMIGDVLLGKMDDQYTGAGNGFVAGIVFGEDGNDTLTGSSAMDVFQGGTGMDALHGQGGNDILFGDAGNDTISGDTGNDMAFGGAGNDSLDGGAGNDTLFGEAGNDTLKGGLGNDEIDGDQGDDKLLGGGGNDDLDGGEGRDTLKGGSGQDTLSGGASADDLTGGADADVFFFRYENDSTETARDTILDFEQGLDRLDFSEMHAFVFAGATFAGGGQASIRVAQNGPAGRTEVFFDIDGDGTSDGAINLSGLFTLTATDFIL